MGSRRSPEDSAQAWLRRLESEIEQLADKARQELETGPGATLDAHGRAEVTWALVELELAAAHCEAVGGSGAEAQVVTSLPDFVARLPEGELPLHIHRHPHVEVEQAAPAEGTTPPR